MKNIFLMIILLSLVLGQIINAQTSFNITNQTSGDTLLTITNNGYVGIGTTDPIARLDLHSSDPDITGSLWLSNSDISHYLRFYSGRLNSPNPLIFWNETDALRFGTSLNTFTEYMRIANNGFVGIGTSNPTAKLTLSSINGTVNHGESAVYIAEGGKYFDYQDGIVFRGNGTDWMTRFTGTDNLNPNGEILGIYKEETTAGDIVNGAGNAIAVFRNNGNVGIGVTDPQEMLQVADTIHSTVGGFKFPDNTVQTTAAAGSGVSEIDDLTDAKYDGTSLFLGTGAGGTTDDGDNYNVAVGKDALNSNISGVQNTANGFRSLYYNTEGNYNTANGYQALVSNISGDYNSAIGCRALYWNQTGSYNIANGYLALYNNRTGSYNTANGYQAIYYNVDGDHNTANGDNTLFFNQTGDFNTANGTNALHYNRDGDFNSAIGCYALFSNMAGSNGVAIGYESQRFVNNTTIAFINSNTSVGYQSLRGSIYASDNTGSVNSALGYQTLYSNTSGSANTANGQQALYLNTTGSYNTANGYFALSGNTSGDNNIGIGYNANSSNKTGSNNTIIGHQAGVGPGSYDKTGSVFLGYQAGYYEAEDNKLYIENSNSTTPLIWGDFSTDSLRINGDIHVTGDIHVDGTGAGVTEINDLSDGKTGGYSVFLGSGAGTSDDGTNNYNTAVGNRALFSNTSAVGNTAIGEDALLNMTSGTNTAVGANSLYNNTSGSGNVGLGVNSNYYNQTGSNNTIIGHLSGHGINGDSKSGSVFLGYQAGYNETEDNRLYIENSNSSTPLIWGDFTSDSMRINGDLHVTGDIHVDGTGAGVSEIDDLSDGKTGGYSVFLGSNAGTNDDGSDNYNTALGNRALFTNISAAGNTAIGEDALYNTTGGTNTAIGSNSLYSNTIGSSNVGLGMNANFYNQTGSNNTIIGHQAGQGVSGDSKSGCVFLGYQAGYNETEDNKLYIENSNSSSPLIGGDFATDEIYLNGNVGIGTTNPLSDLSVGGDGNANYKISAQTTAPTGTGVYGYASYNVGTFTNTGGYFFAAGYSGRGVAGVANNYNGRGVFGSAPNTGNGTNYGGYFEAAGRYGRGVYGSSSGADGFGVHGNASGTNGKGVMGSGTAYDFDAMGPGVNYGATSSIRWKKNIIKIAEPLDKIKKIRGVYFDWDEEHGGGHDVGCIAEEVGKVLPEIVVYEENGIDADGMDYSKLTPLLIEAIKAQQELLKSQNDRIKKLEKQIEQLIK